MPNDALIDPEAIENLRALNPDDAEGFLRDIVGIFLEDTPARLSELKQALADSDGARFTRAAHSIKGSSSNIGANKVRLFAERLEHDSRTHGLSGAETGLTNLEEAYSETADALRKLIGA